MIFNDSTNKENGVVQMFGVQTNLGIDAVTGDTLIEAAMYANTALKKMQSWAKEVDKSWMHGDRSNTTFPVSTANLVNGRRDYSNTFAQLISVEILGNNGNYYELKYNPKRISASDKKWQEEAGIPTEYYRFAGSIIVFPKPDTSMVTATKGIRVTHKENVNLFIDTSTDTEVPFDESLHDIVPAYMTMMWADTHHINDLYQRKYQFIYGDGGANKGRKWDLQRFYAGSTEDYVPKMTSNFNRNLVK